MTEQEMKRLSRAELLEIIILQSKENETLKEENGKLRQEVEDRRIAISEAGDLAEASLRLSGIFEDAEAAVAQYKENIVRLSKDGGGSVASGSKKLTEAKRQAAEILTEAQREADSILAEAEAQRSKAKRDADRYWNEVSKKLDGYLKAHPGLRDVAGGKH